jgi:single-strand DNA-binding protein
VSYDIEKGGIIMINKVILVGRLTRDPDLKYLEDGNAVASITLAVNRNFKNSQGEYDTDFLNCTLWRKNAENTANYCKKGSIVGITGRIQTRSYENSDGAKVYVTEVIAEGVKFLSSKKQEVAV